MVNVPSDKLGTGRHDLESKLLLSRVLIYFERGENVSKDLVIDFPPFRKVDSFSSSFGLCSPPSSDSRGYQPRSLKHIPVPGRVQIANKKWWTRSAGMHSELSSSETVRSYDFTI
jgi:hypothetical protein